MLLSTLSVDRFLAEKPLAITLSGLEELRAHIAARLELFEANPRAFVEMRAAERAAPSRGRPRSGATGIIPVHGAITQHPNTSESGDFASTEDTAAALREFLADDEVSSIVLDIDSPGGTAYGVAELAREIRAARGQKPIVAVANSVAASAAYWIGASADQFYVTPGGLVGSIGVYAMHVDASKWADKEGVKPTFISAGKYKTEANEFEPLGDEARTHIQSLVDDVYAQFVKDVAAGRDVPEATVRDGYGEGRVLTAKRARAAGMVDGIYTLSEAIHKAATLRPASSGARADDEAPDVTADALPSEEDEQSTDDPEGQARLGRFRLARMQSGAGALSAH